MELSHKKVWIVIIGIATAHQILFMTDDEIDKAYDQAMIKAKSELVI